MKRKLETNNEEINKIEIEENKKDKSFWQDKFIFNFLLITIAIFSSELLFKAISNYDLLDYSTLRIFISSILLSLIITFISSITKRRWLRNTINILFTFIYTFYLWLQLGFLNYLGVYMSFNTSSQFGAVKDYIFDYLSSFKLSYYLMYLPFIFVIVFYILIRKKNYQKIKFNLKTLFIIPIILLLGFTYYETLTLKFMQNELQIKSNIKLFKNPDVPTIAVNQFGGAVFGILDLKTFLFPVNEDTHTFNASALEEPSNVSREVSPLLSELASTSDDKKYDTLNKYFASQSVTDYNSYTGMLEGKNVVVILMESVNEAFINEEYFPNFTKLYNEGWSWTNNYSPRNSCATGNNEFSAMTGLYSIYNTCTTNVYKNNSYFEAIFNLFNEKGYVTNSMHDFVEWYYARGVSHPNMGSGKYYNARDLDIETASYYGEWPSDVEFFDKAFDIILNDGTDAPWMTWLTTVTSHQPYSSSSTYGDLYMNDFKALGYSTAVSRYLSKLKVLDEAIGLMLDKLEAAGELDNTVIVMLADHYPYGLSKSYVSEIVTHELSDYEIERTPFVIYNSEMTPQKFSDYTSYINLVPTLANLMNLDYDPRLYVGSDLLSEDYESLVVFADGSWKNEIAYYNASTSKIKYYTNVTYTIEEIQAINEEINLKISMSSQAIKKNYFAYLEEKIKEYEESIKEEVIMETHELETDSNIENTDTLNTTE